VKVLADKKWLTLIGRGLDLPERRLREPLAAVVIPLDHRVIVVSSLNHPEFSRRLSEVSQTLDAISGNQSLTGGSGLGQRWLPSTV
jgi:hypothetical protein